MELDATASKNLSSYTSSNTSAATISGKNLSIVGPDTAIITAS